MVNRAKDSFWVLATFTEAGKYKERFVVDEKETAPDLAPKSDQT